MKRRTLYITLITISLLIIAVISIGVFAVLPTLAATHASQTSTPTPTAQTTPSPVHKNNGTAKILKQYAPEIKNQIAQGLHVSSDQLTTQLHSGKTLSDIATAQKVSASQLQTIVGNAVQNGLKPAVAAGTLTQKQVDKLVKKYQSNPQALDHLLSTK